MRRRQEREGEESLHLSLFFPRQNDFPQYNHRIHVLWITISLLAAATPFAADPPLRPGFTLEGQTALLTIDLAGGAIADFHLRDDPLNPLSWAAPNPRDLLPAPHGHFLCLDRWGPPSENEAAKGMPFHGEAAHVQWQLLHAPVAEPDVIRAEVGAKLPLAHLSIKRIIRLSRSTSFFTVREEITNNNPFGRIYNAVQHPTIAPPFLDESTIIDCNGGKGFAQGGSTHHPEEPSFSWPHALKRDGASVDPRHLTNDPEPNVVSYAIDAEFGWVTAASPRHQLLIGYIWRTRDYPWVSLWRDVKDHKPSARGLEFGTTGLHQPFPILVRQERIFGRSLFEFIDAGETQAKSYSAFLLRIPPDYAGVQSIQVEDQRLVLREEATTRSRALIVPTAGLLPR